MIRRLVAWGEERDPVRAMLLTSTRAIPGAPVDLFSDYDVVLAVTDVRPYFESRAWLEHFGKVLVLYRDPLQLEYGFERFAYITQYEDGNKIDFTVWQVEILRHIATLTQLPTELDAGYRLLLDKDGLAAGLKPPSYQAYIPVPPDEAEYRELVETFFHEATYVVKHLWRDELLPAKYNLDHAMKQDNLRPMLEWRIEIESGWSVKPGTYGKGLKKRLPPELWAELESTYAGPGLEENWEALFRTIALFRRVALEVGAGLGFAYPHALDHRAIAYFRKVKGLERGAVSF